MTGGDLDGAAGRLFGGGKEGGGVENTSVVIARVEPS